MKSKRSTDSRVKTQVRGSNRVTPQVIDYSEFPNADDEYTPAQRKIIDARLAESDDEIRHGLTFGPFDTVEEMIDSLKTQLKIKDTSKT